MESELSDLACFQHALIDWDDGGSCDDGGSYVKVTGPQSRPPRLPPLRKGLDVLFIPLVEPFVPPPRQGLASSTITGSGSWSRLLIGLTRCFR